MNLMSHEKHPECNFIDFNVHAIDVSGYSDLTLDSYLLRLD